MKTIKQYKKGDKVRILKSACSIGVPEREVGKIGRISHIHNLPRQIHYSIMMEEMSGTLEGRKQHNSWRVLHSDISPVLKKGEQLFFAFMA